MHGHTLSFTLEVEGREVVILVQNRTFIAQVVSEGMRLAMETYNNYLWMTTILQPPLNLHFPQIPFYHMPTWEMPLFNPLTQPPNMETPLFPPFLFQQQVSEGVHHYEDQINVGESLVSPVPNNIVMTSQVIPQSLLSLPPQVVPNFDQNVNLEEIEDAIELLRETRVEIGVLKDIKVMIFTERYVKKHNPVCPLTLSKSSIDIRIPCNQDIGNFVVVMSPTLTNANPSNLERGRPVTIPP